MIRLGHRYTFNPFLLPTKVSFPVNFAALKSSNFRTYILGSVFSLQALWMQRVTIGWIAWDMTGSSSFVGLIALLLFAPSIVLSPFFGVLVDRLDVKRAIMAVQVSNLIIMLAFFGAFALGWLSPALMVALTSLTGAAMAANHPMRMSLTPRLVPREMVGSVLAIVAINFNVARMIGPAIGGALIGSVGVGPTLLIQACLVVPFVVALSRLEVRARRSVGPEQQRFWALLVGGFRVVLESPLIRQAMIMAGIIALVGRGALEILPPLADGVFERGPEGLGALLTATGVGAVLGGLYKAVAAPQLAGHIPRLAVLAVFAGLLLVSGLGIAPTWGAALVTAGLIATVTTFNGITLQTAIQLELEDDMRGRVMSLWAVIFAGGSAIGAGVLGVAGDLIGIQPALVWAGGAATLVMGLYWAIGTLKN